MSTSTYALEVVTEIDPVIFRRKYLGKKPLLIKGMVKRWPAVSQWAPAYIANKNPQLSVPIKLYKKNGISQRKILLNDYVDYLAKPAHEQAKELLYCHDIPIFNLIPELAEDILKNTIEPYIPTWYRKTWWKFAQFFMGPKNSLTPLHFDCLLTHNFFFQITGKKRFSLIAPEAATACRPYNWRYFDVDLENPQDRKNLADKNIAVIDVIVEPGDGLYMPPGTLHQVRGLDNAISFNLDFQTKKSALQGVVAITRKMPLKNVYYNFLTALGVIAKVPFKVIFPFYKSYLNYVS